MTEYSLLANTETVGKTSNTTLAGVPATRLKSLSSASDIDDFYRLHEWEAVKLPSRRIEDNLQITPNTFYVERRNKDGVSGDDNHGRVLKDNVNYSYKLIQYPVLTKFFDYFLSEGLLELSHVLFVGEGKKLAISCDIKLPNASIVPGDDIYIKFIGALSHDGTPRSLHFATMDAICENTLAATQAAALNGSTKESKKYFRLDSVKDLETAKEFLNLHERKFYDETRPTLKSYENVVLSREQVDNVLRDLLNLPKFAVLEEDPELQSRAEKRYDIIQNAYENGVGIQDRFGDNYTGYRFLNAVTEATKGFTSTSESNGYKSFYGQLYGTGKTMRNNTVRYLDMLVGAKEREAVTVE